VYDLVPKRAEKAVAKDKKLKWEAAKMESTTFLFL
jgi:hypothetical protein